MNEKKPRYYLTDKDAFVIENYNYAKPFANFFPGIAGKYGIPMWVFYVNRGQGLCSFGTKDKDHAIVEFQPANKSWHQVFSQGFRTLIKIHTKKDFIFYEPFHNGCVNEKFDLANSMAITSYDLTIEETNKTLGLSTRVEYFTIPQDSFAALARIVTLTNTSKAPKNLELLDGIPQIVPYGVSNLFLKKLSRTIEAWMDVENLDQGVPFYKLDVDPTDRPQVLHIKGGNFYLGFYYPHDRPKIIKPIVDPDCIFGQANDFYYPRHFLRTKHFPYPRAQVTKNKTPCGFLPLRLQVAAGKSVTYYSLIGTMRSLATLNGSLTRIVSAKYLDTKRKENKALIGELQSHIDTRSSDKKFDDYLKQTYLDNIMRGGLPITFASSSSFRRTSFYLYSRKHGDLERDYNKFQVQPTYFSQGNGNYRDVNQNRRNDVWFNPSIHDETIISFFNLLQADGFNPLVVKGETFVVEEFSPLTAVLMRFFQEKDRPEVREFLAHPFSPGELIFFIEERSIALGGSYDELLNELMPYAVKYQDAEHGEGFWIDHWTYTLDLLERYLSLYPEELKTLFFGKKVFTYYDNSYVVKPRHLKYVLIEKLIRQSHAVMLDGEKKSLISKRHQQPHVVRTQYGIGEIYRTTLINKLLCLLVNKFSSFDPCGVGIEMEADKPNWFDALNGLPALFGSSACETFELKRLVACIKSALQASNLDSFPVSEEIAAMAVAQNGLLEDFLGSDSADRDFLYWDKSSALKESYRQQTRFGFSGKEQDFQSKDLARMLDNCDSKINIALDKARTKENTTYTSYFFHEVISYEPLNAPFIKPLKFKQTPLPLFLQGQVHGMRLAADTQQARQLHLATKASALYDKKLKMYKVTSCLSSMAEEIGRCRVFTPGWLENESIWLHMEYKYLLELLKQGLHKEFYEEFKTVLIPFQKPQTYGRSILENSSFIVSSAFVDKSMHGNGFVARLSGSTAEMIHIWLLMSMGEKPFFLNDRNELTMKIRPLLAGWLFDAKGKYRFNLFSSIAVTYHNPKKKDTFGTQGAVAEKIIIQDNDGNRREFPSDTIPSPYAQQIREGVISAIDVHFA